MRIDWRRGKFSATLESQDFQTDWKGFLAAVREQIPPRHRHYIADKKAWVIKDRYAPLVEGLAREHLTPALEASPDASGTAPGVTAARAPSVLLPTGEGATLGTALEFSGDRSFLPLQPSAGGPVREAPAGPPTDGPWAATTATEATQPPTAGTPDRCPAGRPVSLAVPPPDLDPHHAAPEGFPTQGVARHAAIAESSPSAWPFFLLSLSFAAIGLWFAWNTLPPVMDYFILELPVFPVFHGVVLSASAFAGISSVFYALWLLLRRR